MQALTLTHPEPDAPTPAVRVTDWRDMQGRTVRAVVDSPAGRSSCVVFIVFDDDSWATVMADVGYDNEAEVDLGSGFNSTVTPASFLSPEQLLAVGLVNRPQFELLKQQAAERGAKEASERAARLRAEADRLEAKAKAAA